MAKYGIDCYQVLSRRQVWNESHFWLRDIWHTKSRLIRYLCTEVFLADVHGAQIEFESRRNGWLCTVTLIQSQSGFKTGAGGCIRVQFVLGCVVIN